jgi:Catalase
MCLYMCEQAAELGGTDPDYATRDLYNAIASGDFPSWTLYLQVMSFEHAQSSKENPFDVTKTWSHKEFPLIEVMARHFYCNVHLCNCHSYCSVMPCALNVLSLSCRMLR